MWQESLGHTAKTFQTCNLTYSFSLGPELNKVCYDHTLLLLALNGMLIHIHLTEYY